MGPRPFIRRAVAVSSQSLSPGPLNHLALTSLDLDRSAKFYCDVLGFQLTSRPSFSFDGRWLYREEVGAMIHLIFDTNHQIVSGEIETRGNHFAMQCEDIELAIRQLKEHAIDYVERVLPDHGYRQIFFRDPDGHVLELGEWPAVHGMVARDN